MGFACASQSRLVVEGSRFSRQFSGPRPLCGEGRFVLERKEQDHLNRSPPLFSLTASRLSSVLGQARWKCGLSFIVARPLSAQLPQLSEHPSRSSAGATQVTD